MHGKFGTLSTEYNIPVMICRAFRNRYMDTYNSGNYAPFEEEGVYCFINVRRSVGRSVDKPCPINN